MSEHFDAFEAALREGDPYTSLRQAVKDLLGAGAGREALRQELEALRVELRAKGREDDGDVVLDVLDDLTGWTSPHRKL